MRGDARLLADDHGINVHDLPPLCPEQLRHGTQQSHTVGPSKSRVGVGEQLPDVTKAGSAQQRVHDGMRQDVGVTVAQQAIAFPQSKSTEHQRPPRRETVGIEAHTHPEPEVFGLAAAHRRRSASICSARRRSERSVILMFCEEPWTIVNLPPSASTNAASSVARNNTSSGAR